MAKGRDSGRKGATKGSGGKHGGGGGVGGRKRGEPGGKRGGASHGNYRRNLATFVGALRASGLALVETARDGNCFFRALADQMGEHEGEHDTFRQRVVDYMEAHLDAFAPFLTFGEGDEEEDEDYDSCACRHCVRLCTGRLAGKESNQVPQSNTLLCSQPHGPNTRPQQHQYTTGGKSCSTPVGKSSLRS